MTREEAGKLLGRYATGSLTELEQQLLFDAALEDQELFDELADEQALKELIELPGAKRRLLEALGPEKKNFEWWPWAAGVAVAATIAVGVWVMRPKAIEAPVEIAENKIAVTPAPSVVPEPAPEPLPPAPEAPPRSTVAALEKSRTEQAAPPPAPAAITRDEVRRPEATSEAAARTVRAPQAAPAKQLPAPAVAQGFLAGNSPVSAPSAATVPGGDALTYEVKNTGFLRLVPARAGVLEVSTETRTLLASSPVTVGVPIEVSIPLEARQLRIDFAATANAPAVTAVGSEQLSGTLTLPGGANPRIAITIPAQR